MKEMQAFINQQVQTESLFLLNLCVVVEVDFDAGREEQRDAVRLQRLDRFQRKLNLFVWQRSVETKVILCNVNTSLNRRQKRTRQIATVKICFFVCLEFQITN